MKVTQVKCPKCELPLYMETQDEFFYCSHCGTIHTRNGPKVERIPYEIADFRRTPDRQPRLRPLLGLHPTSHQVAGRQGRFFNRSVKR